MWKDDRPRVMADLGCHAGHGRYWNDSDALIWLRYFNHSRSLVVAVDVFEDFVLDVQRRFDEAWPYKTMRGVSKRALTLALSATDGQRRDLGDVATAHIRACAADWIAGFERDLAFSEHLCRITRKEHLHLRPAFTLVSRSKREQELAAASYAQRAIDAATRRQPLPPYLVDTMRVDTLWRKRMSARHIDVLKIDVDVSWLQLGLGGLFEKRAFTLMIIEMDYSWGDVSPLWGHSQADQLIWFAARHRYTALLKVPCTARVEHRDAARMEPSESTWYYVLANASSTHRHGHGHGAASEQRHPYRTFLPDAYFAAATPRVQDLMFVDATRPKLLSHLIRLGHRDCVDPALHGGTVT